MVDKPGPVDAAAHQRALDRHEVEVTRAVTAAVTKDLEAKFEDEVRRRDTIIAALQDEVADLHERLHLAEQSLDRLRSHPVLRLAQSARRRVERQVSTTRARRGG